MSARRLAALVVLALVASAIPASAGVPHVVLDRPRIGEFQPARDGGWLAWQQNSSERPRHYDVFVRPAHGGTRIRANPIGTSGANGDVEGDVLVYQEFVRGRSGLRFLDLSTGERRLPPDGVNTRSWEYWPSLSGRWLLFGRLRNHHRRSVILFDLSTGDATRLARIRGADAFLAPGQVNGRWAVWYRCPTSSECNVLRYNIETGNTAVIPNPGGRQRSPSVDPDGTVYYVRGQGECGNRVRVLRKELGHEPEELWRLPNGDDVGRTYAQAKRRSTVVLYDHFSCGRAAASDVWALPVADPTAAPLSASRGSSPRAGSASPGSG
jgi:hypothetical protein